MTLSEHIRKGSISKKRIHFRYFKEKDILFFDEVCAEMVSSDLKLVQRRRK